MGNRWLAFWVLLAATAAPEDAAALRSARPDVKVVVLPGVNHVLKLASGKTVAEQMAAYTDRSIPLAPGVVPAIADFMLAVPGN